MLERDGPLLALAAKLRSLGPPSLGAIIYWLRDFQEFEEFRRLVREFLPEREGEILARAGPEAQVEAFADYFEARYFPLDPSLRYGEVEGYADLTGRILPRVMGLSWEDYHELELRPGLLLMTYLLEDPWEEGGGGRVPLGEACAEHFPIRLLQRVPVGGLSRGEAHRLLDGTLYEGLALWADVLAHETGNPFLDVSMENAWEEDVCWEREVVEHLAREWPQAQRLQQQYMGVVERLEGDLPAEFDRLLDVIEERRREVNSDHAGHGTTGLPVGLAGGPGNTPG